MPFLTFDAADVRRVVEHSLAAPRQSEQLVDYDSGTGKPITKPVDAPAVLLVHDQGVYLMSNGNPRDIVKDQTSFCASAHGCHPDRDPDWYETARSQVGGDDFGETLPWANDLKALLDAGATTITLRITADNIEIMREAH